MTKLAYSYAEAASASGVSVDIIKRAVKAGDLKTVAGTIGGVRVAKPVILAADLAAWLRPTT